MCVINEIKHSFKSLRYLINPTLLIYPLDFLNFCHVGYLLVLICVGDVTSF